MKHFKVAALFAAGAAVLAAVPADAQTVGLATTPQGSFTYTAGSAIAKGAAKAGLRVRVLPHGGTGVSVPAVDKGEADFVLANHNELRLAVNGEGPYDGRRQTNIRVAGVILPLRTAMFVKTDEIKTVADLKGKRVPTTFTAQKALDANVRAILANGGLTYDDIVPVPVSNVVTSTNDFIADKADAFFIALGAGVIQQADAKVGGVSALSLDDSPEAVARMHEHVPVAYPFPMKKGSAPAVNGDINVMAIDFILLTNKETDGEIVKTMLKSFVDHKMVMGDAFKPLLAFSPQRLHRDLGYGIEYHPAAIEFVKEQGLM